MKKHETKKHIEVILNETRTHFDLMTDAGGNTNMDYADYAAYFGLSSFRTALQNPDLSHRRLAAMLRRAGRCRLKAPRQKNYWDNYINKMVSEIANSNETAVEALQ